MYVITGIINEWLYDGFIMLPVFITTVVKSVN